MLIVTGTTGGGGAYRTPPLWMKGGDVVEVEVSGIGVIRSRTRLRQQRRARLEVFLFDALSSREPISPSLENAMRNTITRARRRS
jgi:hypothetical protein